MAYYMAFDGGGNKLKAIIYDDDLNVISFKKSGGINGNFYKPNEVQKHVDEAVSAAIDEAGVVVKEAYGVFIGGGGYLENAIAKMSPNCRIVYLGEGYSYLLAAALTEHGTAVISGTGATIYHVVNEHMGYSLGGLGADIGDEGSGFYIGEHGIRAALQYLNGWGEPTILLDLFYEYSGLSSDDSPLKYFYGGWNTTPLHMKIACFTHAVEKACGLNDKIAIDIVTDAGDVLCAQTLAMIGKYGIDPILPVALCGGGWKTSHIMSDVFTEKLHSVYPQTPVIKPEFEPIIGGIIYRLLKINKLSDFLPLLKQNFFKY